MKKYIFIIFIIAVIAGIYLLYSRYARLQESKLSEKLMEQQRLLVQAQTAQDEACSKNWLCATQGVFSGIGGVFSSLTGNN